MDGRKALMLLLLIAGLWQGWARWHLRAVHPGDGVLAPADPIQVNVDTSPPLIAHGKWLLKPRATYDITARILSREDYHFDGIADLVPEDLALGWGAMSDNRILHSFDISQGNRFYFWHASQLPIPRDEVISHSANTHVIPGDAFVRSQLRQLRVGQVVHLEGLLVDGLGSDGRSLHTSMVRTDSGPGACEIMLVASVEIIPPDAGADVRSASR